MDQINGGRGECQLEEAVVAAAAMAKEEGAPAERAGEGVYNPCPTDVKRVRSVFQQIRPTDYL